MSNPPSSKEGDNGAPEFSGLLHLCRLAVGPFDIQMKALLVRFKISGGEGLCGLRCW